jgi:hypothetical protein
MLGLFGTDARGQAVLPCFAEFADDPVNPFGSFALAENHFGESAALTAIEVHLSVTKVGQRRKLQALKGGIHAKLAGADLPEQCFEFTLVHTIALQGGSAGTIVALHSKQETRRNRGCKKTTAAF